MLLNCQRGAAACIEVALVPGLGWVFGTWHSWIGGVSVAAADWEQPRNPLESFESSQLFHYWPQNSLRLRCWDFSSSKIKFCGSDEKKINYFILHLWKGETKSRLYFWEPFESACAALAENWRLCSHLKLLYFLWLFLCLEGWFFWAASSPTY